MKYGHMLLSLDLNDSLVFSMFSLLSGLILVVLYFDLGTISASQSCLI